MQKSHLQDHCFPHWLNVRRGQYSLGSVTPASHKMSPSALSDSEGQSLLDTPADSVDAACFIGVC